MGRKFSNRQPRSSWEIELRLELVEHELWIFRNTTIMRGNERAQFGVNTEEMFRVEGCESDLRDLVILSDHDVGRGMRFQVVDQFLPPSRWPPRGYEREV